MQKFKFITFITIITVSFIFSESIYVLSDDHINNNQKTAKISEEPNKSLKNSDLIIKDLVPGTIGYISISDFTKTPNMDKELNLLNEYLERIHEYETLVLDIRESSGNNSEYWHDHLIPKLITNPLKSLTYNFYKSEEDLKDVLDEYELGIDDIPKVKDLDDDILSTMPKEVMKDFSYYFVDENVLAPKNSIKFQGQIYILVDNNLSTAARDFVTFANETGFATIIGSIMGKEEVKDTETLNIIPNSKYTLKFFFQNNSNENAETKETLLPVPHYEVNNAKKSKEFLSDECIKKVLELEKIDGELSLGITNKDYKFKDTVPYLAGYEEKNSSEFYEFIGNLLTNENGKVKYFGDATLAKEQFNDTYGDEHSICLQYKQPMKISLQSKSDLIPDEYRDNSSNIALEIKDIEMSYEQGQNLVVVYLSGENKGIIIEFYDSTLAKDINKILSFAKK